MTPQPGDSGRAQPVEGALLGIRRSVAECARLVELAKELPEDRPTLALLDGSLILWGLVTRDYPGFVIEALLEKGYLNHLGEMMWIDTQSNLAVAGYISFPRSTDVVNALRVAICPQEAADCECYCAGYSPGSRPCDAVAGVQDRELFSELLSQGERSALFLSTSSIVRERYGRHRVYFCYLKVDDEIARIEFPEWVARDENRLHLAHALILDQCRRGQGYPVALSEAHEQAVVTTADRGNFWQVTESYLDAARLPTLDSAKRRSKRTRWV
jgi:hypothetical protein